MLNDERAINQKTLSRAALSFSLFALALMVYIKVQGICYRPSKAEGSILLGAVILAVVPGLFSLRPWPSVIAVVVFAGLIVWELAAPIGSWVCD